jgi:hypothetical protein
MTGAAAHDRRPLLYPLLTYGKPRNLNEVALRIAVRLQQETGCPAQLVIAQWAIESAWGAN